MPNAESPPIGVVLAGGESRRMGRDKTRLTIAGQTLVARAAARLAELPLEVVIADRGQGRASPWPSVSDGLGRGPAAGLLGAAELYPGRKLLALACDLPLVPVELLRKLMEEPSWDWVLPESHRGLEPLCALYSPRALAALARRIGEGRYALHELAQEDGLLVRRLGDQELRRWGEPEALLTNLNSAEDWSRLGQLFPGVDPP